ncbi:MAG TPA: amidohydrolase family protein [Candidatus Limnocylindrales bacterium]|nr:amidohydrolase family protein [Candidatus Limnocylindrales bacterium]
MNFELHQASAFEWQRSGRLKLAASQLLPLALGLLCSLSSAVGQSLLLSGATVHTVTGETLSPGQVLIQNGKIAAVGTTVPNNGVTPLDLTGQHLYPGIISLDCALGLIEIEAVRATADAKEVGDYTPDVESWIAINPDSELLPVARANGIAYFEPVPTGGIVSGQSGLLTIAGWTAEAMAIRKPVALHLFWPTMELNTTPPEKVPGKNKPKALEEQSKERREALRSMMDFFAEAAAYAKARSAAEKQNAPAPETVPAWEAMLPYIRGDLPITIHADEIRQIKSAVTWASTNHYKIILAGARDAWKVPELLASNHVSVIYEHTFTQPVRESDSYDVQFTAPALLHKAGMDVSFAIGLRPFDAPTVRNLPYAAAQAVAFGLPEDEAVKGLTLYPARLAGVADRLGSIDVGKEATLFSSDGSILDIRANVKHMWIAGKEVSLDNRHTRLYEKYKNRPKS